MNIVLAWIALVVGALSIVCWLDMCVSLYRLDQRVEKLEQKNKLEALKPETSK